MGEELSFSKIAKLAISLESQLVASQPRTKRCSNCGHRGHEAHECRAKKKGTKPTNGTNINMGTSTNGSTSGSSISLFITHL